MNENLVYGLLWKKKAIFTKVRKLKKRLKWKRFEIKKSADKIVLLTIFPIQINL